MRVFGEDLDVLRAKADEVEGRSSGIDGVDDLHTSSSQADVPQIEVEVDLAAAQRYGLKPGDVRRAAATLLASEEVGDIFRDGRAYDVHVWSTPEHAQQPDQRRATCRSTRPAGGTCASAMSPTCASRPTPNVIHREDASRRIDVGANVDGPRSWARSSRDVETGSTSVDVPAGYHAELLGEYAERQARAEPPAGLRHRRRRSAIFLLLQASFGSWRLATLVFLTLPMALVGGVLAASSPAASSRSARSSASSRCWGSPRATASC